MNCYSEQTHIMLSRRQCLELVWQAIKYMGRVFHCVGKCPILVHLYNKDMEGKNILLIKIGTMEFCFCPLLSGA